MCLEHIAVGMLFRSQISTTYAYLLCARHCHSYQSCTMTTLFYWSVYGKLIQIFRKQKLSILSLPQGHLPDQLLVLLLPAILSWG